jgi:hypothetical protein
MEFLLCNFLGLPVISSLLDRHTLLTQNLFASLELTDHIENMDVSMIVTHAAFRYTGYSTMYPFLIPTVGNQTHVN